MPRLSTVVRRIDAQTPPSRDRAVDALRAIAILGVVLGHWLVTALTLRDDGTLRTTSPLKVMPELTPASWVLQTLAVFFLVGGYVAGLTKADNYGVWLKVRMVRLFKPVSAVLALWAVAVGAMTVAGVGDETVRTMVKLVLSPLWFLLVFAALTALTPLLARLNPLWPVAVVGLVDVLRFGFDVDSDIGFVNVLAGWMVPFCLGIAWARGVRVPALGLFAGGALATAALIFWGPYPASMVGVPGAEISNLNPPTLAAVTFGLAQCGLALLLLNPLRRLMRRPVAWACVALVNLSAMTVFLWHQTAMMTVTVVGASFGSLRGLTATPDSPGWVFARLAWFPVFVIALLVYWSVLRRFERGGPRA
jgi:peptidoglycan/LPS O-acetylase OafA/YrhL